MKPNVYFKYIKDFSKLSNSGTSPFYLQGQEPQLIYNIHNYRILNDF